MLCNQNEWHQMKTLIFLQIRLWNTLCRLHTNRTHTLLIVQRIICMQKNWTASIGCRNNLSPTMKESTHCAVSVTWLTAKNIVKFNAELWCAAFTYKRWCHLSHLKVSRMRMARLPFSDSGILLKWLAAANWDPCLKESKSWSSQTFSCWLIGKHRGRGQWKKLFCI